MKKIISAVLCIVLLLSSVSFAYADESNGLTPEQYAQSFINTLEPDRILTAVDEVEIFDENDQLSGYCVSLQENGQNSGYVVILLTEEGPTVSEYVCDEGVGNIYDEITETNAQINSLDKSEAEKKIYSFEPNEYMVSVQQDTEDVFVDYSGKQFSKEDFKEQKEQAKLEKQAQSSFRASEKANKKLSDKNVFAGDIANSDGQVITDEYGGTIQSQHSVYAYIKQIVWLNQNDFTTSTNRYACTVAMATNLMKYYRTIGYSNIIDTNYVTVANKIWDYAGTESHIYSTEGGVDYSGNTDSEINNAIKKYVKERGYSFSLDSYLLDSFNDFKKDLDQNHPVGLLYSATGGTGHAVLAVGYKVTTADQYIQIVDGWNSYVRYLNFSGYSYSGGGRCLNGYAYKISLIGGSQYK